MSGRTAQTIADGVAIVVALVFLTSTAFAELSQSRILAAVALFVIGLSLLRIWRRYRG